MTALPPDDFASAAWREHEQLRRGLSDAVLSHFQRQEDLLRSLLAARGGGASDFQPPLSPRRPRLPTRAATPQDEGVARSSSQLAGILPTFDSKASVSTAGSPAASKRRKSLAKFLEDHHVDEAAAERTPAVSAPSPFVAKVLAWHEKFQSLEEPPRQGCLKRILYSKQFETFVTLVILANSVYTTYQANYEMRTLGDIPDSDVYMETMFMTIFSLEILAKLCLHRAWFFVNHDMSWNLFDFILVTFSLFDQVLSQVGVPFGDVSFARALRIFRMGKILRIFRAMRFLKELRVMVNSILGSLVSLGWSIVMLGLILYVFALFFVQQVSVFQQEAGPEVLESDVFRGQVDYLGSVQSTMLSLAMCTTGGKNWEDILVLLSPAGFLSVWAFGFYIAFFTFAVMNILTGIFVESAMALCTPDEHETLSLQRKKRQEHMEELTCILETLDVDGSGTLNVAEVTSGVHRERVYAALQSLGVDIKDPERFFGTLASVLGSDEIDIPTIAAHTLHMKGGASSIDLHSLMVQTGMLQQSLEELREAIGLPGAQAARESELHVGCVEAASDEGRPDRWGPATRPQARRPSYDPGHCDQALPGSAS